MKKLFVILLSLVLLATFALSASAAVTLNLINNKHSENNLLNPIANVLEVSGDVDKAVADTENLGVVYVDATEISDMTAFLKNCKSKGVVPTLRIDSKEEADKIVEAMGSKGSRVKDVTVVSSDASLLSYMREKSVFARGGLIYDLTSNTLSSKDANVIREAVRSAPATFCIVESANASKQAVAELQALAVAVWVRVSAEPGTPEFDVEVIKAVTSGANGIISKDVNAVTNAINTYLSENAMTRTPLMIGHRGNPTQAPENSLSGFITAYENGADIFEIDVEITADGEIIILHDGTLNRTTNYTGTKRVGQMKLSEIKEYFLLDKSGNVTTETVPTLREVLDEFKDKDCRIFVEFKGSNNQNVIKTAEIIKEYGMQDRVDVISFNAKFLAQTQTSLPGMSTGCLVSYDFKSPTYEDALVAMYRAMSDAQNCNSTINIGSGTYSRYFQQAAVDRGMTVWPWTYLASSNDMAFMAGCDGLTTDDVQWAKDMAKYIKTDSDSFDLAVNNSAEFAVSAVTYGGEINAIDTSKLTVSVISGGDFVKVENGNLVGVAEGTAAVVYGYPTKTTANSEYVLYTQPITVNVTSASANGEAPGDGNTPDYPIYGIIGAVLVVIGAVGAVVIVKKKK